MTAADTLKRIDAALASKKPRTKRFFRKCMACKKVEVRDVRGNLEHDQERGGMRYTYWVPNQPCIYCGENAVRVKELQATKVLGITCDNLCRFSEGWKCRCSCGGEHHGEGLVG